MSLTLEDAKQLRFGDILLDKLDKRWKVNGRVQTWKRDPKRIRVPLKHGLYIHDALTDIDFPQGVCDLLTREQND